jgi:hypothetical protein
MEFKGTRSTTLEDINSNATAELRKIPKEPPPALPAMAVHTRALL